MRQKSLRAKNKIVVSRLFIALLAVQNLVAFQNLMNLKLHSMKPRFNDSTMIYVLLDYCGVAYLAYIRRVDEILNFSS